MKQEIINKGNILRRGTHMARRLGFQYIILLSFLLIIFTPFHALATATGDVWLQAASITKNINDTFSVQVHANVGSSNLSAFDFKIQYDSSLVNIDDLKISADDLLNGTSLGTADYGWNIIPNNNTAGEFRVVGFAACKTADDPQDLPVPDCVTPASDMTLLTINFKTLAKAGSATIPVGVQYLPDQNGIAIGTPNGTFALITVVKPKLTVTKSGSGSGAVNSDIGGIACGGTCSWDYNPGDIVTLTAAADPESEFKGWSGSGCSGTGTCQVTMDTAKNVFAEFASLDSTPPSCNIIYPQAGALMASTVAITGSASDVGSSVAKVEVSINNGGWLAATGKTSWSYNWIIPTDGISYTIKCRATDTAGNVETPGTGVTVKAYKRDHTAVTVSGRQLSVKGSPFTAKGVVYSPVPIGETPDGDFFTVSDSGIYTRDLPLIRQMGANTVRIYGWDDTADHHDFLDNAYNNGTNPIYVIAGFPIAPGRDIDPQSQNNERAAIKEEFVKMVSTHKNHPAILMWAIGSDLNATYSGKLANLFSLINEMALAAHQEEGAGYHPVTTPLTDTSLINTIMTYNASVPNLDVWGANVYRGKSFGTLFSDYKAKSAKPLVITEYGIDAYDNVNKDEYENIGPAYQAEYAEVLWKEITANSDSCIGGALMEYSDEWWKGDSTEAGCTDNDPTVHGTCGFADTSQPDSFSNEEWWGIMRVAKNGDNPDTVDPRYVYTALQYIWTTQPGTPGINLVEPNGGEKLSAGDTKMIRWTYTGNIGKTVKIELFKGGVLSKVIASSAPAGVTGEGSYKWTIPAVQIPGSDHSIKITVTANVAVNDTSSAFTINAPTLAVTSPSGGETWLSGSAQTISWTYKGGPGFVKIELLKAGKPAGTINAKAPLGSNGQGAYTWAIPPKQAEGLDYSVRITGTANTKVIAVSNNFTIKLPTVTTLTLTSPGAGTVWSAGIPQTISWTYTGGPGPVKIELLKAGKPVGVINAKAPLSSNGVGTYAWTIPPKQAEGQDYTVRITSTAYLNVSAVSDSFRIKWPTLTVTSPNGGETWIGGATQTISWTYTGGPGPVKIQLIKGGTAVTSVNAKAPLGSNGQGSYTWTMPAKQAPGSDYRIVITGTANTMVTDTSNNNFTVIPPTLKVTSPNGGETWLSGSAQTISWTYTGGPGPVKIELLKAGKPVGTINAKAALGSNGQGSYTWAVPPKQAEGLDYSVKITSTANTTVSAVSNSFAIKWPTTSELKVTSPNGGETWPAGTQKTISWTYTGGPGPVKIELLKAGKTVSTINAKAPLSINGLGSYLWTIPATMAAGADYTIRITSTAIITASDISDGNFTISR